MNTQTLQWRLTRAAARVGWVAIVIVIAGVSGCEQPRADVSGTVSYRGRAVVYGTVIIIGSDQATYHATIQPDGTFTASGIPTGPAKIGVYSPDPYYEMPVPTAVKAKMEQARRDSGAATPPKPPKGQWFKLPAKCTDPLASGMTVDVAAPTTTLELRLD